LSSVLDAERLTKEMPSNHQMPIPPKSRGAVIRQFVMTVVVFFFVLLAVVNLCHGVARMASILWLTLVTAMVWSASREVGGLRLFLTNWVGDLFGRRFVRADPPEVRPRCVRFGFVLLGLRFVERSILLDRIESLEWAPGQASALAGKDLNDWRVWLWFDHKDSAKTARQRKWGARKPEQDLHGVGPAGRKDHIEALARSFLAFLQTAGVDLVQGAGPACFVRRTDGPFSSR
jgi:hypothetical protein